MAISKVVVVDGNNLIVRIDRGVAGRGVTDVEPVVIDGSLYLVFTFSDGTTETVGPVGTIQYVGQAPIVVNGSTISLSTVPVNLGGTGQVTANAGFNALAPTQTGNSGKYLKTDGTNSAWDLLDISTADITGVLPLANGGTASSTASGARTNLGLGTIATQDASNVSITGGTITGITDLAVADGGTGSSTAAGAMVNLLPSYTGNANKRLGLDGTATGLEWVTDGGGTVTSVDVSGGTTGLSFSGGPVTTSGTITLSGTLDLDNGGTGATTAAGARTNLNAADQATTLTAGTGLSGGGDLTTNRSFSITNTGVSAAAYGAASKTLTATVNAQGQLTVLADTPIAIANTQISGLGTMSTQNANAVAITGGSITGITDLAVADGGTGASDAAGARTNLNAANQATTITAGIGLSGGGDLSANRTIDIANTTVTAGAFGSASNTLTATVNAQGQLTALAATPIAIANTQVSGLGTMSTQNSNAVTITGGSITGITDLAIADGGTGASNAADARSNLGLGSAAVLNAGVALGVATLDAGGTVPLSQIPASIQGGVSYQGAWNASTNTPTLVSSVGSKGFYYVVSVAGNTNLNGVTDWLVGDWAIYNGTAWEKIDNTDQVASVNGYTGVVVLSNTDVGAPPTSLTISAGTGLTGGGSLAANRTLSIANTTVTAAPYGTASAVPTFTVNGQGQLTAASDVTIAIANTQVSGLGTMSTQNANSVAITGGSITGITDLAVADGGTGASTAGGALTNLGAIGSITSADGSIIVVPSGTSIDLAVSAASPASTLLTQVRNTTGATLTKGTVVYISGASGQISTVSKAIASGDSTSAQTLGMITANLANNTNGYVTVFGLLTNMDTSAYTDGAQLYLSGTVAGEVTATKPSAPIHLVYVAVVEYAHPTLGKLLVKVQNGYELEELHDVSIVTPVTGQTLVYNSATDLWVNNTVSLTAGVNGTLPILNGGTGQTTANAAFNALAPSQTGNSGKYLTTDGTDTSWASNPLGTVTSVAASVPSFLSIAGSPITTSGTLAISLSGTALPTTSGGTGLTSFTSGGVVYASSTSALATGSALTFDGTNLSTTGRINTGAVLAGLFNTATGAYLQWNYNSTVNGYIGTANQAISGGATTDFGISSAGASSNLIFGVNTTEVFRATSTSLYTASGISVGIGTTNPIGRLEAVGGTGAGFSGWFRTGDATAANNAGGGFYNTSSATAASRQAVMALDADGANLGGGDYFVIQKNGNSGTADILQYSNAAMRFGTNYTARAAYDMTLDSAGNLGLGVTPNAGTSGKVFQITDAGHFMASGSTVYIDANAYFDSGWKYITSAPASNYYQSSGAHIWQTSTSAQVAGTDPVFSQAMTLDASSRLLVGYTSAVSGLTSGAIQVGAGPFAALVTTGSGDTTRIITDGAIEFNYDGVSGTQRHGKIRGTGNSTGGGYAGGLAFEYYSFNGSAYQWYTGIELDSVGNVAIGKTSASYRFDLQGAVGENQTLAGFFSGTNTARGLTLGLSAGGTGVNDAFAVYNATLGGGYSGHIWQAGGAEQARINQNGNFGIGTNNPLTKFVVYKEGSSPIPTNMFGGNITSVIVSGEPQLACSSNIIAATGTVGASQTALGGVGFSYVNATSPTEFTIGIHSATVGSAVRFFNGTERGRFTTSGYFKASNGGSYTNVSASYHELRVTADTGDWATFISHAASTTAAQYGLRIELTGDPNGTSNEFLYCSGASNLRMAVRSNGGIANYAANNVVLSDRREKTNFAPAGSYLDKICAIPVQTFNYIDQNLEQDGGLTLGVVAQDVQAVAPELVNESNWAVKDEAPKMRLEIYQTDMQYALMKALQELNAKFEAYKASHP